ncbi:hypothetical protein niasHS_007198 [Heterodera schachtii]|uniref:Uncharacterized protein n=1 Tax=Heterodera schachtii TaxID=97005 RepID=A0ABD2JJR0_HETSC
MESVSVRVVFWRCFHSLFCVSPSPLKLFLLNVFAIAQSSGCFAGGGQTICCPPSSLVGCAPAVPICQMNYGYGSYGGGGSYAAPLIVNYPRPFGYQQQTQAGGRGEAAENALAVRNFVPAVVGAGEEQFKRTREGAKEENASREVGVNSSRWPHIAKDAYAKGEDASRIEVLEEGAREEEGAKEGYAKDVEGATGAWEAEDAREEEISRAENAKEQGANEKEQPRK